MVDRGWITLQGAVNARDVGGLPTGDGGTIAPGRLLRSDNLQDLTPSDVAHLVDQRGVRLVVDLRTGFEVAKEGPTPLQRDTEVRHVHLSLLPEVGRATDLAAEDVLPWRRENGARYDIGGDFRADISGAALTAQVYRGYLRERPDNVLTALRSLAAQEDGAALVHCAAGKDRTGVIVALALSVAGVPREAIVADYVATGDVLEALVARLVSSPTYAPDLAGRPLDSHRPVAESMWQLLAELDESHGGPSGWLSAAGFDPEEQRVLRRRLVA